MTGPLFAGLAIVGWLQVPSSDPSAQVLLGMQQVKDGQLTDAVATLDVAVLQLRADPAARRSELTNALVYQGWALVGLVQEEKAKAAFREALTIDPDLRLRKGQFPDRVIRVFEAARTGKSQSVMERPSDAPKKAGIGGLGVAAIVGGAVLVAGGAAATVSSGGPGPVPSPSPSPTPNPNTSVTPAASSGPGQIAFVSSTPGPGTVTACGGSLSGCRGRFTFVFNVRSNTRAANQGLRVQLLLSTNATCYLEGSSTAFDVTPGDNFNVAANLNGFVTGNQNLNCRLPLTIDRLIAIVGRFGLLEETFAQEFRVSYPLTP